MKLTKNQWEKLSWVSHSYKRPEPRDGRQAAGWHKTFSALKDKGLCLYTDGSELLLDQRDIWTAQGKAEEYETQIRKIAEAHPDVEVRFLPLFLHPENLPWDRADPELLKTTFHVEESWGFAPGWSLTDLGADVWCRHSGEVPSYLLFAHIYHPGDPPKGRETLWEHFPTKEEAMEAYRDLRGEKSNSRKVTCYGVYRTLKKG